MQAKFAATQSVSIPIPPTPIPIRHYLRQPKRLVHALVDPRQTEQLSDDCFRLKMRSRQFLMLTLQPIVDLQLWNDRDDVVRLRAVRCELSGLEFINQQFELSLEGYLAISSDQLLEGQANLSVCVEIPPMLWMTPKTIINAAGNRMLSSILSSVKHRLVQQIIMDYLDWVEIVTADSPQKNMGSNQMLPRTL